MMKRGGCWILTVAVMAGFVATAWSQEPNRPVVGAAPATVEQAAAVLDLSTFPLAAPDAAVNARVLAGQSYSAAGQVTDLAAKLQKQFADAGWKLLDGATIAEQYASCTFQKGGFTVSLSIFPGGEADKVSVTINNHGNVNLAKLPVPPAAQLMYAFPTTIAYTSDRPVEEVNAAVLKQLLEAGWEPYGQTTVSFFVKQNAVRLQVMVSAAPAQGGKTMIQISSEQLSHDFPAPPNATEVQYADSIGSLFVEIAGTQQELEHYFRTELGRRGWTATTDKVVKIDFWDHLIFRNPRKDLVDIEFKNPEGKAQAFLKFQSAADVEREDRAAQELAAKKQAEMAHRPAAAKIEIRVPVGAKLEQQEAKRLEFSAPPGRARAAVQAWIRQYEADGWKSKKLIDEAAAGDFELTKGDVTLDVLFVDPGIIVAAEITVSVAGNYELVVAK